MSPDLILYEKLLQYVGKYVRVKIDWDNPPIEWRIELSDDLIYIYTESKVWAPDWDGKYKACIWAKNWSCVYSIEEIEELSPTQVMNALDQQAIKDWAACIPIEWPVNPGHYQGDIQPIDLICAQGLSFNAGNAVKYLCRYKRKNWIEDLKKAIRYIEFEINIMEGKPPRWLS